MLTNINNFFPTLFSKVFFVLGAQLFITSLATYISFRFFKKINSYFAKQTNLTPNTPYIWLFRPPFFYTLLILSTVIFLILCFWGHDQSLLISFSLFSIWSVLTGIVLEYCLLEVGHNLGAKALMITALIVFLTAIIGIFSHIDFSFLQVPLFVVLVVLIYYEIVRLIKGMSTFKQKILASSGIIIFTLYLVLDFNILTKKESIALNSWNDAMDIAIKLYLDIINLFLSLLDLLSKFN